MEDNKELEENRKTIEGILKDAIESSKLTEESLKYIDNIVNNLAKLRGIDYKSCNSWIWLVAMWLLLGFPIEKSEDKTKEENNETD